MLDQQHVGVEGGDVGEDLAELAVAHVGLNLGLRSRPGGRKAEARHRPAEIVPLVGVTQRQSFAQAGSSIWMIGDPGFVEIGDLVPDGERDLAAGLRARLIVADERPVEDRHRPRQHPLHRALGLLWAKVAQRTVIGRGRATSPKMIGGRT